MRQKRLLATVAASAALLLLLPIATALGKDGAPPLSQPRSFDLVALGTGFTYQGRLTDAGNPANGSYDLRFVLYDAETGGNQVGIIVAKEDVTVTGGFFAVLLDFGDVFDGNVYFLTIEVRPGASATTAAYTVLSPRLPITPTPNALFARRVGNFSSPGGLAVTATGPAAAGLTGKSTATDGAGVIAEATGETNAGSTALDIRNGVLKVSGPANGRTAFQLTGGTPVAVTGCAATACGVPIDHPYLNNAPTAMLQVTQVLSASVAENAGSLSVLYIAGTTNKWFVVRNDGLAMTSTLKFNVLIIRQ